MYLVGPNFRLATEGCTFKALTLSTKVSLGEGVAKIEDYMIQVARYAHETTIQANGAVYIRGSGYPTGGIKAERKVGNRVSQK